MKHGEIWRGAEASAGRCVVCDEPLPLRRNGQHGTVRKVCCGSRDCNLTYWQLRKARIAELVRIGLLAEELRGAHLAELEMLKRLQAQRST